MTKQEPEVVIFGIGDGGIQYARNIISRVSFQTDIVAIDTQQTVLDALPEDIKKIKVSKRLQPDDAVDRIASKLRTSMKEQKIAFVLCDIKPGEPSTEILPAIANELARCNDYVFGIVTTPAYNQGKKTHNQACKLIDRLLGNIGVLEYPNGIFSDYMLPETVLVQTIEQVVQMLNFSYMDPCAAQKVVKETGRVYLIDEIMDSREWMRDRWSPAGRRAHEAERLNGNRLMDTMLMAAEGLLVHITASSKLRKEDLQYFLLHLQGMIGIDAYMDVAIDIDETLESKLRIELLGTGVYTQEDWDEMFY